MASCNKEFITHWAGNSITVKLSEAVRLRTNCSGWGSLNIQICWQRKESLRCQRTTKKLSSFPHKNDYPLNIDLENKIIQRGLKSTGQMLHVQAFEFSITWLPCQIHCEKWMLHSSILLLTSYRRLANLLLLSFGRSMKTKADILPTLMFIMTKWMYLHKSYLLVSEIRQRH